MKSPTITWQRLVITAAAALSTYYVRWVLAAINLQPLTFLLPVLFAGYFFGAALAVVGAVLSLLMVHAVLWLEAPGALFTAAYFRGMLNFFLFSGLIVLYTYRHEQVLRRLDQSLERETAARQEAEAANRLKDQFLATLSHELRTPINVILGYLRLLLDHRTPDPRRALEIAHRNAQQQARLIEDVLDVSRMTTGTLQIHPEQVRPVAPLRDAVDAIQPAIAAKGLQLRIDAADDPDLAILADPDRLRQVFWNLLSNAVKFTPEGGRIEVRVHRDAAHVEIVVCDTGRGIASDFLPHVFEIFRQADPSTTREVSGMGVGLSLVKRFVELQGGQVRAASDGEGQGATFTCRFPLAAPAARPHPAAGFTPATELPR